MPLPTAYTDGTATITNGSVSVVGQGTSWRGLWPGDVVWSPVDGVDCRIDTIEDDTHLTLAAPWPGTSTTADPYEIRITPDTARMQEQTRRNLDQLSVLDSNSQGLFYNFLGSSTTDADPGVGKIAFNNASLASATAIYIDNYDANTPNRLVTGLIGLWTGGTSLIIRSLTSTAYVAFKLAAPLADATGYRRATSVVYIGGDGTISDGEAVSIAWFGVGEGLHIDAIGTFAGRTTYNASAAGFVYASTNGNGTTSILTLYRKNSATSGDWSAGAAIQGAAGFRGWSPRHAIVSDGDRRVWQVAGYIGGEGTAPTTGVGQYVSTTGYTATIADAIDVRGTTGLQGDSAYAIAVASGFVGDVAAWLASLNGTDGADGTDPGVLLIWSTSTADANPGSGVMRANQATLSATTLLYVSKANRPGDDISTFLSNLGTSSNPARKGSITLTRSGGNAQATFDLTAVTDATGYVKLTVANGSGVSNFSASDLISLQFAAAGDRGASGAGTGSFNGPATSVSGNLVAFDGTAGDTGLDSGISINNVMLGSDDLTGVANPNIANDNLNVNGADIASGATLNLETATGSFVEITGTTATTAITLADGHKRRTRAAAAWPITVGASLTLNNGGVSYTCTAGDIIDWVADGTVVRGVVSPFSGRMPGVVVGPASSVSDHIPQFADTTGKLLKDGLAIQSSAIDATAGSVLLVGAFGLGAVSPTRFTGDLNTVLVNGWTAVSSTATNKPPGAGDGLVLTSMWDNAGAASHEFTNFADGKKSHRVLTGGTWTGWSQIYKASTILGTVSQSSGVPTGAVIERGSNANGSYVRFADGTQICSHTITTGILNVASGAIFASPSYTWSFPAAFASGTAMALSGSDGSTDNVWVSGGAYGTTGMSVKALSWASSSSARILSIAATGRWF